MFDPNDAVISTIGFAAESHYTVVLTDSILQGFTIGSL